MPETTNTRVAVYIDFDNIIISRYNQLHGPQQFSRDSVRNFSPSHPKADVTTADRIERATVDISAILDYASSFGTIAVSRAYADWSALANARYQKQLIERAVDLTQLFPTAGRTKNGADIRLAVDALEDMFRLADITHVIIVAGDSDYIALAQSAKRLGRYVVGIGVTGSTSGSLAAACDEFADYDALPGVHSAPTTTPVGDGVRAAGAGDVPSIASDDLGRTASTSQDDLSESDRPPAAETPTPGDGSQVAVAHEADSAGVPAFAPPGGAAADGTSEPGGEPGKRPAERVGGVVDAHAAAADLLVRAVRLIQAKSDAEWLYSAEVKAQMRRMDPSFQEVALGFRGFTEFVNSLPSVAELDETSPPNARRLRVLDQTR